MILHTVLFQPKADIDARIRRALIESLRSALTEIPTVRRARVGRTTTVGASYEGLGGPSYEFLAIIEFDSVDDLRSYLRHPLHAELGRQFWLACERTLILDSTAVEVRDGVEL